MTHNKTLRPSYHYHQNTHTEASPSNAAFI